MPENEIRGWSPAEVPTMAMAETLVWDMAERRPPGRPQQYERQIAWKDEVTREQHEQHPDDIPDDWRPIVDVFETDHLVTAVQIISMQDLSRVVRRRYEHSANEHYHIRETTQWNPALGNRKSAFTKF
jgi:hypothetical protein